MDKPADPATSFREVYQQFLAILTKLGRTVCICREPHSGRHNAILESTPTTRWS